MTKSFSKDEFTEYVLGLKFHSVEDAAYFIRQYYNEYLKSNTEDNQQIMDNYWKYMTAMAVHGPALLHFVEEMSIERDKIHELLEAL